METCDICGKECKNRIGLMAHKRTHKPTHKPKQESQGGEYKYVVCFASGGYKKNGLEMPQGKVVKIPAKDLNSIKCIRGVQEVKI